VPVWTQRNSLELRVEYVQISALKQNAQNPRAHPEKQIRMIAQSINVVGFVVPCLIGKRNRLVNGHARVLAAERPGMDTVPCIRLEHLSEVDRHAYMIVDAKSSELAAWNHEILRSELRFFSELNVNFDFSLLGFETAEA
jgi:ParB-like chromosome segregation protein Spo0J